MKLKKIASLALAGIMAVSMLAGCKYGEGSSSSSSSSEVTVSTGLSGQVIAALSNNTTKNTDFSSGSDRLNLALEIALEKQGANSASSLVGSDVYGVDATLASANRLPQREDNSGYTTSTGTDSEVQTALFVVYATAGNDESGAYKLAAEIDDVKPMTRNGAGQQWAWNELPDRSKSAKASGEPDNYYWAFEYTAQVAATKVMNSNTNEITYVAAVLVTRTPTKTAI